MKPIVAYYRVSTARQGKSGLGLDAQRAACSSYAEQHGYEIVEEFTEVETGSGNDALSLRRELSNAITSARKRKCALLVAKLDRLSRDVAFVSNLIARGVEFTVAELGEDVEPFMLHIYAAVAQKERSLISERTKTALQQSRLRGTRLGNRKNLETAQAIGREVQSRRSDDFSERVLPIIEVIFAEGGRSFAQIARRLNTLQIPTARGGQWHPTTVRNLLVRCGGSGHRVVVELVPSS